MKGWYTILFLLVSQSLSGQQTVSSRFDIDSHINQIMGQLDETVNEDYYNLLIYYYDNPINLNKTDQRELAQLGLLSIQQIDQIISYRNETGPFKSPYELQVVKSLAIDEIRAILPFVIVSQKQSLKKIFSEIGYGRSNYAAIGYSRTYPMSAGYSDGSYIGSPDRTQLRLRLRNPGHLSIGLSAQKDPGENWVRHSRIPAPDYVSGHIYLENQGRVKQLALGDYRLQFGQGLVLGSGFMVGKNAEAVTTLKQSNLGVIPYSSITENSFFRGFGTTVELSKNIDVSLFYSNQHLDATPIKNHLEGAVSAIRTSGLHRTGNELEAQDLLHEQVWGNALVFNNGTFSTGILITGSNFDKPIIPPDNDYNQYYFSGSRILNYSWFGHIVRGNFLFFGELAKTQHSGSAANIGVIGNLTKNLSTSILFRSMDKDFHSLYGLTFSERSRIGNESGIYWGINLSPAKRLKISGYYDMYKFPWLTSLTASPSQGREYLLRLNYKFNEFTTGYLQLRKETSEVKENTGTVDINTPQSLIKTIVNLDYNLEKPLTFRTRIQYNHYSSMYEYNGWLVYQDINYKTRNFGISGRLLLFDTEDFAARQYAYEKDMLFSFNTRMFNGKGVSYYLLMKIKPVRNFSIRMKWSYTEYLGLHELGSGNDLINGNSKNQFSTQIHYSF